MIAIVIAAPLFAIQIAAHISVGWALWVCLSLFFVAIVAIAGAVVVATFRRHIEDLPCPDEERLERFRRKMRRGPVGHWMTRLGEGEEIVHGEAIEFGGDGSGRFSAWGGDELIEFDFEWRSIGNFRIEVREPDDDDWRTVAFDFHIHRNVYDVVELRLVEPGVDGFLWSPSPLTFSEPIPGEQY